MQGGIDFSKVNWNMFNPKGDTTPQRLRWMVWDPLARLKQQQQEYEPLLAKDFTLDGTTATINLREDYTWHDGDPLTSADVVTQWRIQKYLEAPMWDFAQSVSAPDDYTVKIEMNEVNPEVVWPSFLGNEIFAKKSEYGTFLEELESSDGSDKAVQAVQEHQVGTPIGNGPFEVTDVGQDVVNLKRFPDYARADNINWSNVKATFYPEEKTLYQAAIGDELDGIDFVQMPDNIINQLPDHWEAVRVPGFEGPMIAFGPKSDVVGENAENAGVIRTAIAYMFDFEQFTSLINSEDVPAIQSGMSISANEKFLGDKASDFTRYGKAAKTDKATQILEDAGFSKKNGTWMRPNGKPLELPVKFPAGWTGDRPAWQNVADQFKQFGINSEGQPVENSTFFGPTIEKHDFEVAIAGTWGVAGQPYPYFGFRTNLGTLTEPAYQYNPEVKEYEVPMPVGNPDGDTRTVNVDDKIQALGKASEPKEAKRLIRELAWTVNQALPYLQPTEGFNQHFITRDQWSFPSSDSALLKTNVPFTFLPKIGEMQATK
ncbi:ABC transporter substrate-binding protein [Halopelagius longus]|nr:ABC transporter substrate-binding protein [Halopelagius longus]